MASEGAECVLMLVDADLVARWPPRLNSDAKLPLLSSDASVLLLQREISRFGDDAAMRSECIMLPSARSTLASPTVLYTWELPLGRVEQRRRDVRGVCGERGVCGVRRGVRGENFWKAPALRRVGSRWARGVVFS